jgi:multidrug efflux system membrane fusion protein
LLYGLGVAKKHLDSNESSILVAYFVTDNLPKLNRIKVWAAFVCLALAAIALNGCAGSTTDASDGGSGKGGKGGGKAGGRRSLEGGGPAPVTVAKVSQKDVPIEVSVVGNVEAYATITIIPQVGGALTDVFFHEGDYVKKGDKLFTIDPRPLQAALAQSEANLLRDQALLGQANANVARDTASEKYARDEAGRYMKLFDEGIVSREQGDQYRTNADTLAQSVLADKAAIESAKAQMAADRASIDNARVQLSYTTLVSPINGKTGNLMVKQGNVVSANTTQLIGITQVEPIYVTFSVPETNLTDVKRFMAQSKLAVVAKTQDGEAATERGELTFVDNNVDMTTGTIKLKGTFENSDRKLWPGQYVNVTLRLTTRPNALVVPNQAVQSGQDGSFVYVVDENRRVAARPVVTGPRIDQDLVIDKGLEAGETVVTEGQLRLAPGSQVQLRDANGGGGRGGRGKNGDSKDDGGAKERTDKDRGGRDRGGKDHADEDHPGKDGKGRDKTAS